MKKLLCTFCCNEDTDLAVDAILSKYQLLYKKIYVFENLSKPNGVILSYNVSGFKSFLTNTISINRNSKSNTLYTINAMNRIIVDELGYLDKQFIIDWKYYSNKLLTTSSDNELIQSDLRFVEVKHF